MNADQVQTIVNDLNVVQPNGVLGGAIARRNPGAVALINTIDLARQRIANEEAQIRTNAISLGNLPFVGSEAGDYLPSECAKAAAAKK